MLLTPLAGLRAADKPLRAIAIDAGFDEADCSYHSITLGSVGRIYFSLSGHRIIQRFLTPCSPLLQWGQQSRPVAKGHTDSYVLRKQIRQ